MQRSGQRRNQSSSLHQKRYVDSNRSQESVVSGATAVNDGFSMQLTSTHVLPLPLVDHVLKSASGDVQSAMHRKQI